MDVVLPKPGGYVVAVSGGVDSMALLDILRRHDELKFVVAHLDHGIRPDSAEDRKLVQAVSEKLGLPFYYEEVKLGARVSEAVAREARYKFLHKTLKETGSLAIITAHHQDDMLETAIINMLRGSGRKGLTSLASRDDVVRPLLGVPKAELIAYATQNKLSWREDSTNEDDTYLRNYVRHQILPRFDDTARARFLKIIGNLRETNTELDTLLVNYLESQSVSGMIERSWFNQLSHSEAKEVLASWLRLHGIRNFDSKGLERLVAAAKTAAPGKSFPVTGGYFLRIQKSNLALEGPER